MTGGSDRFEGKNSRNDGMCLFLEPGIFGEAKSTDSSAMGVWTGGRTDAFSKNAFFEIPSHERNPKRTGQERTLAPSALLARSQFLLCFHFYLLAPLRLTKQEIWQL